MNEKVTKILEAAKLLEEALPTCNVNLSVCQNRSIVVSVYSIHDGEFTYKYATELMRSLGIRSWEKAVQVTYTELTGKVDDIEVRLYPDGLPPTCRKVKYIERIPKTQTVTLEGDFIEVEREKVVCSGKGGNNE